MKADSFPLKSIFGKDVQYVVPLYQRPYVWRKETHWEPLWEDIQVIIRQLLGAHPRAASEERPAPAPHFLGAVVLDQQRTQAGSVEERHIIDGQQRLTTLQLLLAASSKVADQRGHDKEARLLRRLVHNDPDLVTAPDHAFKVWPTNVDRDAFRLAIAAPDAGRDAPDDPFNLIQEAHSYFHLRVDAWLDESQDDGSSPSDLLSALTQALREFVQIVVIDLEERDNAQVIFETLNARGTPLLAIDLVKNLIFLRAQVADVDVAAIYRDHWRQFERSYWREEVRQGRLSRARAEVFLMHWLTMKRREEVVAHQLYNSFRGLVNRFPDQEVGSLVAEFAADGRVFESFDRQEVGSPEHRFFTHLRALDTTTVMPLILYLFRQPEQDLPPERRLLALSALESWLIRRMLCGLTPKNYNRFVLELLRELDSKPGQLEETLIRALREATADTNLWPDDARLDQALLGLPFYRRLSQARVRTVLAAVENAMRSEKSEEIVVPTDLTIEHILPQAWEENWPTNPPNDIAAKMERDQHIHRLGNLTLVTHKLNPSLSNAAWPKKREELNQHSLLLMNRRIVESNAAIWDEARIDARSAELAGYIKRLWPGPEAEWTVAARQLQLKKAVAPPEAAETPPQPEDLIARFAGGSQRLLMERLLEEISSWEGARVWVGKSPNIERRRIFLGRQGSPYGRAFCFLNPRLSRMRIRVDPDDVPFARWAEPLDPEDPYRLRLALQSDQVFSEALSLARVAYDKALETEQ